MRLAPLTPHILALALTGLGAMSQSIPSVLLFTRTAGYRHDSIPTAVDALHRLAPSYVVSFSHSEDAALFSDDGLQGMDGVVFLHTTDDVLDSQQQDAFKRWLDKGGVLVGIHSASATLNHTQFYIDQIGATFDYHPELQPATILVLDSTHPSTSHLPGRWNVSEEVYNFKSDPRSLGATILLSVDESTYTDPSPREYVQGDPHPLAWYQERAAGAPAGRARSFYTSLGHLNETWEDEDFLEHVMKGIVWALESNTTLAYNSCASVGNGTASSGADSSSTSTSGGDASAPTQTDGSSAVPHRAQAAAVGGAILGAVLSTVF